MCNATPDEKANCAQKAIGACECNEKAFRKMMRANLLRVMIHNTRFTNPYDIYELISWIISAYVI